MSNYGEWQGTKMVCECGGRKEVQYTLLTMNVRCLKCGKHSEIKWAKPKEKK